MIVDAWIQHPTECFFNDPCFDSLKRWTRQDFSQGVPPEVTLKAMDAGNITKALLSAWYGPNGPLISNEDVLAFVQRDPERFVGIASADLRTPVEAVRTIRHYVAEHGFKGARIIQWLWDLPCTHPLYYPIYTACVELDIPVCLQVGLTGPLHSSESGRPLHIERIALDFPDLKVVCGHIGYPWHGEMIAFATKFPNVYIDTSAYKAKRYPPELVAYMKTNGKRKVMFGSNYPMITPTDCLAELDALGLDDDTKAHFLYKNATSVFGL